MIQFDDELSASGLTLREREVLELVGSGMSAKQIAQDLGIAPRTVERHIENIRNKLRAKNKTHMVAKALAYGVLHVDRVAPRASDSSIIRFPAKRAVANE